MVCCFKNDRRKIRKWYAFVVVKITDHQRLETLKQNYSMTLQGPAAQHDTVTVQIDIVSKSEGANKYDRKLKIGNWPRTV